MFKLKNSWAIKFFSDWQTKMKKHPVEIIGWFSILIASLYEKTTDGRFSLPIEGWGALLNTNTKQTKYFVKYLYVHNLAIVTTPPHSSSPISIEHLITISIPNLFGPKIEQKLLAERRKDWFKDIKKKYHPNRATKQPKTAWKEYLAILKEASYGCSTPELRLNAELKIQKKILNYIEYDLKRTPEWENNGKFSCEHVSS